MSDFFKRVSTLSPDKRRLLEILAREKGLKPPLPGTVPPASVSKSLSLTRLPDSPIVPMKVQGSRPPLFLVHPSDGSIACFHDLARYVDTDTPIYCLQAPGLDGECEPYRKIEELAAHYVEAIKSLQNSSPYLIGGWSMGGIVAYEMAQQLHAEGQSVARLIIIDSTSSAFSEKYIKEEIEAFLRNIPGLEFSFESMDLSSDSYSDYLSDDYVNSILDLAKKSGFITSGLGLTQVERYFKVFKTNNLAVLAYKQEAYPGKLIFLKASELINNHDPTQGWSDLAAGGIEIHDIPGNHFTMMREPHVVDLAKVLGKCLDGV